MRTNPLFPFLSCPLSNKVHVQTEQITCKNQWYYRYLSHHGKTTKLSVRVHHHRKKLSGEWDSLFFFLPPSKDKAVEKVFPFICGENPFSDIQYLVRDSSFPLCLPQGIEEYLLIHSLKLAFMTAHYASVSNLLGPGFTAIKKGPFIVPKRQELRKPGQTPKDPF